MYTFNFSWICLILIAVLLVIDLWKKRRNYYCSWNLPGPFALPILGSVSVITSVQKAKTKHGYYTDPFPIFIEICKRQKSVFKIFLGNDLIVANSEPEDVEVLLSTCFDRTEFYTVWNKFFQNTHNIFTYSTDIWKQRRKEYNRGFNQRILNSFFDTFIKYGKESVKIFSEKCGQIQTNLLMDIWKINIDIFAETLLDIDPKLLEERYDVINLVARAEEILVQIFKQPWLFLPFFWNFSGLKKEIVPIAKVSLEVGTKILALKKQQLSENFIIQNDDLRNKRFSNHCLTFLLEQKLMTEDELPTELVVMAIAATETSATMLTYVILVLGIYPDIQETLYQEVSSIRQEDNDFIPEDINQMEYLERVIKETMRVFTLVPLIMRSIDRDVQLKSYTQPAGSQVVIPIQLIHNNPKFWPNPSKFDPDRFLPDEIAKRPSGTYIPFSTGPRNCIGFKYAMTQMKIAIAYVVKNFVIKTLNCKSHEDIESEYKLMLQPSNYQVVFEKRLN